MNKKALFDLNLSILLFTIFTLMFVFLATFIHDVGHQELIVPTANISKDIINGSTVESVSTPIISKIDELEAGHLAYTISLDLAFLAMWISAFVSTLFISFRTNKEGIFSFFGLIFVGSIMLLLITFYLEQFTDWFISELLEKVLEIDMSTLPIINFYFNNIGLINFIWSLILLLVNIIDRQFISKTGEVEA